MINLPNPVEKNESEEKEFNFKMRAKGSPKNKGQSRMSNFNTTKNINWTASHEKNADGDLQNNSKVHSLSSTMYNTNHKFYNSRQ
jgi:Leucine-rich repeat (LRR) protein